MKNYLLIFVMFYVSTSYSQETTQVARSEALRLKKSVTTLKVDSVTGEVLEIVDAQLGNGDAQVVSRDPRGFKILFDAMIGARSMLQGEVGANVGAGKVLVGYSRLASVDCLSCSPYRAYKAGVKTETDIDSIEGRTQGNEFRLGVGQREDDQSEWRVFGVYRNFEGKSSTKRSSIPPQISGKTVGLSYQQFLRSNRPFYYTFSGGWTWTESTLGDGEKHKFPSIVVGFGVGR